MQIKNASFIIQQTVTFKFRIIVILLMRKWHGGLVMRKHHKAAMALNWSLIGAKVVVVENKLQASCSAG